SIADNLRLARPGATEAELWSALRSVALEERVRTLPDGLDDGLGEDGATLSAGERARLALARVVVADRPWVLLDEPTAHVDELTERIIADTIVDLGRRAGVVVVAHRPALVALADHHVVLPAPHRPRVEAAETSATGPLRRGTATPAYVPDSPARGTVRRQLAVGAVLGALASASGVALTATAGWLIVQASTRPPVLTLLVAIVGVRTFGLARPALRYVERLTSHDAALRLLAARRVQVYESIVPLTPGRLGRRRGDVLASIVDDVDAVVDAELRVRMPARTATLVSSCGIAVATLVLPQAGIVLAAYCVVAGLGSWTIARIGAARAERSYVDRRAALSEIVHDAIQVREELLMWQAVDATCDSVSAASAALGRSGTSAARWSATARAWISATTGVAVAAMAWAALGGLDGGISAPMAALLVLVPLGLSEVIAPLPDAATLSVRTRASAARLAGLEHATPAVREIPATAHPRGTALDVERVRGRWHDAAPVTSEVSFMAAPGERIGIVGASGSGKSTVAALLLRFLDPVAGTISLGGATTTRMGLDEVRALTGLVDDDPHVFATTLLENVRLARPGADARAVESALGRAGLGTWLDSLPSGLDTWLGDGHGGLSGGERARLGLARCLLADQPVLVLDEPTAHLDHTTARALAEHVLRGERRTTVIWITHDPVGLELVDRVVDLGPHPSYVSSARRDDPADRR
ncbi:MAG: thiol reductant ABC exporter subunit CydC, partial [Actinobacteria bacterium]|nr:thiol reductant ABC exporter subunit CydC [Actinomycetota bacterium]